MNKIKIIDNNFSHASYMTDYQISKHVIWERFNINMENDLVFVTDSYIMREPLPKNNIIMMMEPRCINPSIYSYVEKNFSKFKIILSYDEEIIKKCPNSMFYPYGGCWISEEKKKIYNKTKLISIIVSNVSILK